MNAVDLLTRLKDLGVGVQLDGDRLRLRAPQGVLTADLREELAAHRDDILAFLRQTTNGRDWSAQPIPQAPEGTSTVLSFAQQRMWFLNRLHPENTEYNRPLAIQLTGPVDVTALQRALEEITTRHRVLTTTITTDPDGLASPVVAPERSPVLAHTDLTHLSPEDAAAKAPELVGAEAARPFDLAEEPPFRARLIRLAEHDHVLSLTVHHIAFDDTSADILRHELATLYDAFRHGRPSPLPTVRVQYADYAAWQRQLLSGDVHLSQLDYWRAQLGGIPTLELPTDRTRRPGQAPAGTHSIDIGAEVTAALRLIARQAGTTMFMTSLAAFQAFLTRCTGQEDIVVGTPVSGRGHPDTRSMIGFFSNTLVLRTDTSGDPTFTELLARARRVSLDAYANQDLPFEHLVDELAPRRDLTRNPLFDVMFGYQPGSRASAASGWSGLESCELPISYATTTLDLGVELIESGDSLRCLVEYNADLFEPATIEQLTRRFARLLEGIAADPRRRIGAYDLVSPVEHAQLDVWSKGREIRWPGPAESVHEQISAQAQATPEATAVISGDDRVSYAELTALSASLSRHLRRLGAGPEGVIAVHLEPGVELVVSALGVLMSGGVYLPIDVAAPAERLRLQLEDSGAQLIITSSGLRDRLPRTDVPVEVIDRTETWTMPADGPDIPLDVRTHPANAAYLIYTSGSTGASKAVITSHESLLNRLRWQIEAHSFGPGDRVLQHTTPAFDVSLWELCGPLIAGATLVVPPREAARDPLVLEHVIRRDAITAVDLVPSMLGPFLDAVDPEEGTSLRLITCGGENLPAAFVRRCHDRLGPQVELHNLYGPTEASIDVTDAVCDPSADSAPPIGAPHANVVCRVLDPWLNPTPAGMPGELFIGGAALARGYHGRPAQTGERFVPDPFAADGTRMYRTGDLVRWRSDGRLEFLGRMDDQIKIRGHRIEPGEIEGVLAGHRKVRAAAVSARGTGPGGPRLVAYVVPRDPSDPPEADALRELLKTRLTGPMMPASLVILETLPLTASGKIDRDALPDPSEPVTGAGEPATGIEQLLAGIWSEVLGIAAVGVHDDFFDLGGHSLLALQVVARAAALGIRITPAQIFERPTVAGLAAAADETHHVQAEQQRLTGEVGLLPIHHWWTDLRLEHPEHFNQAAWVHVSGRLDVRLLKRAAQAVADHHDALRLRATGYPDDLRLTVADEDGAVVHHHRTADCHDDRLRGIAEETQRSLNLATGPIWRIALVDPATEEGSRLLLVVHHLAIDTVSWPVLIEDLARAYARIADGRPVDLGPKTSSIRQWADHLSSLRQDGRTLAELPYWTRTLNGRHDRLPIDHDNGPATYAHAGTQEIRLDGDVTQALVRQAPSAYRTQINDLLLAALTRALHRWAGIRRCLVDLESHGRTHADPHDLSRTVGWFTTLTPVPLTLTDPSAGDSELIKGVKEQLRAVPRNGLGYGVLARLGSQLPGTAPPEIGFDYHGTLDARLLPGGSEDRAEQTGEGRQWRLAAGPSGDDQHPDTPLPHLLEVTAEISGGQLRLRLTYPTTRFDHETITALASLLRDALTDITDHCVEVARNEPGLATPSDFPLADLSQDEVDRLVATTDFVIEDAYPLSPMQQGLLFHSMLAPDGDMYFEHTLLTLDGPVNPDLLQAAFQHLVDRHPILRTAIPRFDPTSTLQLVAAQAEIPITYKDWSGIPAEQHPARLAEFLDADRARGIDLTRPPLMRLTLVRHTATDHTLVIGEHHLLLDGWSQPILLRELQTAHQALMAGASPRLPSRRPYRDYIAWLADRPSGGDVDFWAEQLEGFSSPTLLTAESPTEKAEGHAKHHWRLSDRQTRRLNELARTHHLTLNTIVRGALALLIAQRTGSGDVCYGATVAGRPESLPGADAMLGLFINTIPVRTVVPAEQPLLDFLSGIQDRQLEQQRHQHTPLAEIQAAAGLPKGTPLFDTILIFNNYPDVREEGDVPGAETRICDSTTIEFDHYPLTLITDNSGPLPLSFSYDRSRFTDSTVHDLADRLTGLLEAIGEDPGLRLGDLPLVSTEEEDRLRSWGAGPSQVVPSGRPVEWIAAQAVRTPKATALVAGGRRLTYAEMDQRANRIAHHLVQAGVGQESVVALLLERGCDLIVCMLAAWKAGAAYLPLTPESPDQRIAFQLKDSGAAALITQDGFRDRLPDAPPPETTIVVLDEPATAAAIASRPGTSPVTRTRPEAAAYLIYTSGSTGTPKAVTVTHEGLANHNHAMSERFALGPGTRALQGFSPGFDAAAEEIFPVLAHGGALYVLPEGWPDPRDLAGHIAEARPTLLHMPAAYWASWLTTAPPTREQLATVRAAKIGGERPHPAHIRAWYEKTGIPLWNVYGPTETTITVTTELLPPDTASDVAPPIGTPLPHTVAYVLDANLRLMPAGVPGELFIGGPQLARGYHRRPALAAERFVPDPFAGDGSRLYRTGDLVRWSPEGRLHYLGRVDDQIKIRGHRMEPGEIESALSAHPRVRSGAVVVRQDGGEGPRLAAFVVPADAHRPPEPHELRAFLQTRLPEPMIPATFTILRELPLTGNGKTDRAALAAGERFRPSPAPGFIAPAGATEHAVADVWRHVLKTERVGARDDFFELGGHSLTAMQIVARLRTLFDIELAIADLFEHPTVAQLAAVVEGAAGTEKTPPISPVGRNAPLELSSAQRRLWFLSRLDPDSSEYNISTALRLTGNLDIPALHSALSAVVVRHEVLRTTITTTADGVPVESVSADAVPDLPLIDLSGGSPQDARLEAGRLVDADTAAPFDLAAGPPLRAKLIRLRADEHVLALTMHHIVADEWSVEILRRELSVLYAAFRDDRPSPLPPLPIQYADYAAWQRDRLTGEMLQRQLGYWQEQLTDLPMLRLPTDRPGSAVRDPAGALRPFTLSPDITDALRALSRRSGASMFMTLLAAFQALLARCCGQSDIPVGTPVSGRAHPDTEPLIGFFINTLVLRTDLTGDPTFTDLLARVRRTALDAYAHQDVPFEQLVDALRPHRDRARHPLFQVMFNYSAGGGDSPAELAGLDTCEFAANYTASPFDLTLSLFEEGSALQGSFEFSTALFDPETIDRLATHLAVLLASVAADPDRRLSELPFVPPSEEARLNAGVIGDDVGPVPRTLVHETIAAHAKRTPGKTAVLTEEGGLTYLELEEESNRLGHLLRDIGVGPETVVALSLPRTPELISAVLAVLKAGGAYLLMDPEAPPERLAFLLRDSRAHTLVTTRALRDRLPRPHDGSGGMVGHTLLLDAPATEHLLKDHPATPPETTPSAEAAAYLIYTSGSTGTPKAAVGTHRNLAQLHHAWTHSHGLAASDVWLTTANTAFDVFTGDWVRALATGATLWIGPDRRALDPARLAELIARHGITALETSPQQLAPLREHLDEPTANHLRLLIVAADLWPGADLEPTRSLLPHTRLLTAYGLTETSIDTTWFDATRTATGVHRHIPVGRPLPHTTVHLLDAHMRPVPPGVPGEIHIAGAGLTRGYHHRPALTAERFIADPFAGDGSRLYRTGDLGRWRSDGHLELLGRTDQQINLRGHRIEPGEVEAALIGHPEVATVAVVAREDDSGAPRLAAYLTVPPGSAPTVSELRAFLSTRLPDSMIPAVFVVIDELPLTDTGKLDRKALPAPDTARPALAAGFVEPATPVEVVLADVWRNVLRVDQVGVRDDFFDLGGDSILSIQVVAGARAAGVAITPAQLFDHPTISELAAVAEVAPAGTPAEQGRVSGRIKPLPIHRWWTAQRLEHPAHFNQATWVEAPERLDPALLERAASAVAEHHDALRLRATGYPDALRLAIAEQDGPVVTWHTLPSDCGPDTTREQLRHIAQAAQTRLDLERGPIWRIEVVEHEAGEATRLLIVVHHLAIDTVSWDILIEDLARAYASLAEGAPVDLGPKTTSVRQWADYLTDLARDGAATAGPMSPREEDLDRLPVDHTTGPATFAQAETLGVRLNVGTTQALLKQAPSAYRTQVNDLLLAAVSRALHRWKGLDRVLIELEGHGRTHTGPHDLSRTIGWFTDLVPVRLSHADDLAGLVKSVKERLRVFPGRGVHGHLLTSPHEQVKPEIAVNYHGRHDESPGIDQAVPEDAGTGGKDAHLVGGNWRPVGGPTGEDLHPSTPMPHLLEITAVVNEGRLHIDLTYPSTRYRTSTIEALADHMRRALEEVVEHTVQTARTSPGSATPSDFPLAGLDQDQVDHLVAGTPFVIGDAYPLSPTQHGMLFHTLLGPREGVYVEHTNMTFEGLLDSGLLREAFQHLVDRHPILRTAVRHHDLDVPLQLVATDAKIPCATVDWTHLSPDVQDPRLKEFLDEDRRRGFDLSKPPLARLTVIRHSPTRHTLVITAHHLLLDGWSLPILQEEFLATYRALARHETPVLPPRRPYRDYIAWLADQDDAESTEFWREQLAGFTSPTPLAGPERRPAHSGHATYRWELPADTARKISRLGRTHRLTLNTVVRGALALLMARQNGTDDVCFGATVAGRPDRLPGAEDMLGLFITTLPVRTRIQPDQALLEFLQDLQKQQLEQQAHQHTPLVRIQADSELPRNTALFDTILVVHNYPIVASTGPERAPGSGTDGPASVCEISGEEAYDHYPLTLTAIPGPTLVLTAAYDRSWLDDEAVERLGARLSALLVTIADEPHRLLGDLAPLPASELSRLNAWSVGPDLPHMTETPIHELIGAQVRRTPDAVAVSADDGQLSYEEMDERANRVAHHLAALGMGPERAVGVLLDRGVDLIPAILGIWKAGGVHLPLDPDAPADRLAFQLTDSGAAAVITSTALSSRLPAEQSTGRDLVVIDDPATGNALAACPASAPTVPVHPGNGAYLIYTSGSTGAPKAVLNHHSGLANRLTWQVRAHGLGPGDVILHKTPLIFDVALWELCCPLLAGATVLMAPPGMHRDPAAIAALIKKHAVTAVEFVPSMLGPFLDVATRDECEGLRLITCAGEALPGPMVRRCHDRLGGQFRIHNLYGPAEAAVTVTDALCLPDDDRPPPIGAPIPNASCLVLDGSLRPVPIGVAGELFIGGTPVARGYHDRPALTAERFVAAPFGPPGSRLYRTGDLARWRDDGRLEFLGRMDDQIKIRGHRVEPAEIEHELAGHPGVRGAAVVPRTPTGGVLQLVAYIVAGEGRKPAISELRDHLKRRLPDSMIPATFVTLDVLPVTPSGKVDRRALPDPGAARPDLAVAYVPPSSTAEQSVARIWQEVLGVDRVGVADDFFELGGHSLLAAQVAVRLRTWLGAELPLGALFESPTLGELAARVEEALIDKIERMSDGEVGELLALEEGDT
ncbi:non-ribosomal peptide synthase/polyketide synthase [Actinomadura nitritigenes]|uniref:non-ribosomal peptide synthase/polyketide synthase n=1 Tax=Actinomadura nitritigenes TaxID=134602 RepID=UPI003684D54D